MANGTEVSALSARILLVDDDRRLLQSLGMRLAAIGCRCTTCNNASEAIVQFAVNAVDLVITDLTMPEIDGVGFIGLIRSQSDVPVIVITGHSDDYRERLSKQRRVSVIRKPFEFSSLVDRICVLVPQVATERGCDPSKP